MAELLEKGVHLSLFSRQGTFRGSLVPPRGKNVPLRLAQFETHSDAIRSLLIGRAVVTAKIANALAVLNRYREKNEGGAAFDQRRDELRAAIGASGAAPDLASLDGIEGAAARSYFSALMEFNKSEFSWQGRLKHPAPDPLNSLLSLTYTLLMNELTALLDGVGLDPYLGFLHQVDYGRPSLALDLIEPFRHPVADRLVLTLVNKSMLDADDFHAPGPGPGVILKPAAFKRYFAEYEKWMLARPASEPATPPRPRYRDLLKDEVERFAASIRDKTAFVPFRFDERAAGGALACSTSSVTI
jgi:CRISPR-associated protein Cas1